MTYEELLEEWNGSLSEKVTEFLDHLGYSHPKLVLRVLDYGIAYADYFFSEENTDTDTDTELLRFLKAICLRLLFLGEAEDTAVPIDSENGRLWERSFSSLSSNHKRLVRLMYENRPLVRGDNLEEMRKFPDDCIDLIATDPPSRDEEALENILQPLNCLKEQKKDLIHDALFKPIRDQLKSTRHAVTAMRYAMEQVLIEGST